MMIACFKDDAIRYVRWMGLHHIYPRWFTDGMVGLFFNDESYTVTDMRGEPIDISYGDYFIMNQYDEIAAVKESEFTTYFSTVSNEVCCFHDKSIFWHHVYGDLDNGEPGSVVIVNEDGQTMEMEPETFQSYVYTYLSTYI